MTDADAIRADSSTCEGVGDPACNRKRLPFAERCGYCRWRAVLLVGEHNPYGPDDAFALYPEPEHSAGGRLCRLVLGMEPREYLRSFDRANLLHAARWSAPRAREEARRILATGRRRLVLLGARVAAAFGLESAQFQRRHAGGVVLVAIPHPSGRCRAWNVPGAFALARSLVKELSGGAL